MSNSFVNFLTGIVNGSGNMRDYQHAARLYVDNNYELTPKAGWIYYVAININREIGSTIKDPTLRKEFSRWYNRYKGTVGLLASQIDLPKFSIETEVINQYNRKRVVQKKINYNPISITFHDDMANVTTNLWKAYYQYYYADSVSLGKSTGATSIIPKYNGSKYNGFQDATNYQYGLNSGIDGSVPFFVSIDVYQLHKKKFTQFKLVNPMIKEWSHDSLDQAQGNKMLTSKMTVEYETVIYDTSPTNKVTSSKPGFNKEHYDHTPSPLSIGGQGSVSIFGPGGLVAGAEDIYGTLTDPGSSPLDLINAAISGANLVRNTSNITTAGLVQEGTGIFNSVLSGVTAAGRGNIVSGALNGLNQSLSPAGISVPGGTQAPDQTIATPINTKTGR